MALKSFKPYTKSRRFITLVDKAEITKQTPEKALSEPKKRSGGRNSYGEVTIWHRGGGHKRQYRRVDFRREKSGIPAQVASVEYDPNRSARLALLHYADGGYSAWERAAHPQHSARHADSQLGVVSRQGRAGGALGGRLGATALERGGNRSGQAAFGRSAQVPPGLHGHGGAGWQHRAREHDLRQGRQDALDGTPSHGARRS